MECLVNITMSIDGYIAGPNGELDWLNRANSNLPEGENCGFAEFFNSIDCLVMGKNTNKKIFPGKAMITFKGTISCADFKKVGFWKQESSQEGELPLNGFGAGLAASARDQYLLYLRGAIEGQS